MLELLLLLVCASILAAGVLAVCLDNLLAAMVSSGLASLFAAVSFLLLAAGGGERLGLGPKAFLELHGRPLLCWLADKAKTLAYDPASDEMVLSVHRWFANKSCPGDVNTELQGQDCKKQ